MRTNWWHVASTATVMAAIASGPVVVLVVQAILQAVGATDEQQTWVLAPLCAIMLIVGILMGTLLAGYFEDRGFEADRRTR